jgi:glycosyltransferase involved in cell wall biosynthesis
VPAILASAGMLERFYTDICGNVGLGQVLAAAGWLSPGLARLAKRRAPQSVRARTKTFPVRTALHASRNRFLPAGAAARYRANLEWQQAIGRAAARGGFGGATHLFSMLGEFPALLTAAKKQGLRVVSEVYVALATERIVAEERRRFPGWEPDEDDLDAVRRELLAGDAMLDRSDFLVCPSEPVREDLALHFGVAPEKMAVVPYGMNPAWLDLRPSPRAGRVLFAGTAGLRKGIHYFAMAAEKLGSSYEFRVAGDVASSVAQHPACRRLQFLGRVPRNRMQEVFQSADIFALPTLAEGSAEVTYEALAAGLPVITTRAAGSVVRDGVEGRIVPERDPEALASAIRELVEDRATRDRMAAAARERARDYTWERYGQRLLSCLRSVPQ